MESTNNFWTYISPLMAALLTYFIAIRGKRKDVDIEKEKKLNIVISNLLNVWHYLNILKRLADIKKSDFPIPVKILPHILLNSKHIDDKCFNELECSIELLKEYDPIIYQELSGIGNRFDYTKSNLILPFLKTTNQTDFTETFSEFNIQETIEEIEDFLKSISKRLGFRTSRRIRKRIKEKEKIDIKKTKEELIKYYYDFMTSLIPSGQPKPTFEEFKIELNKEETKSMFNKQMELFENMDFEQIMQLVAENPYASIEEMKN